ncbi:MAG TPA: hypothetical protein IGS17_11090 [Oscillatoriales cyanobacterium M59_W2019_021]|nr:MAG: hypothetical protein D6728_01960 [Cyanobacteria bacterium J055]HIK31877.1 hypothetical protein [Oscillatoriales cyanobacterium M4454_W2019_049]HIK51452.1 hypothetical protein [Oscillatoriales cyanobacterium M59_W2019_021]
MSVKQPMDGQYDRGIRPAETAAREEREGEQFKKKPVQQGDIDTTGGYTVDQEGLANNYAIEPEMYYEVPGDLREKEEALKAERARELQEINDTDEQGKLTENQDERGKGPGIF